VRILIAGIGNIFLGDDAFGSEVARRLMAAPQPAGVRVVDFGIRGLDLTYDLLEDYDAGILVDAVARGDQPGTLTLLEPRLSGEETGASLELHSLDPVKVLRLARSMGGKLESVLLIGCEPQHADEDEMNMEMSAVVRAAVDEAVLLVESVVGRLLADGLPVQAGP